MKNLFIFSVISFIFCGICAHGDAEKQAYDSEQIIIFIKNDFPTPPLEPSNEKKSILSNLPDDIKDKLFQYLDSDKLQPQEKIRFISSLPYISEEKFFKFAAEKTMDLSFPIDLKKGIINEISRIIISMESEDGNIYSASQNIAKAIINNTSEYDENIKKKAFHILNLINMHRSLLVYLSLLDKQKAKEYYSIFKDGQIREIYSLDKGNAFGADKQGGFYFSSFPTVIDNDFINKLVFDLSNSEPDVRLKSILEIQRLTNDIFGYNPIGSEESRNESINKIKKFISSNNLFRKKKKKAAE